MERQAEISPLSRRKNFSFAEIGKKGESYTEGDKFVDNKRGQVSEVA